MNANTRIQWLHKKLSMNAYPNAQRICERFRISHRQAQRDFDFLKKKLGAPIEYDSAKKGFYYSAPFVLPVLLSSDNDEAYIPEISTVTDQEELAADASIIQMQIPYSATIEIPNKLTALELNPYIIAKKPRNRYLCEFHSIERFMGLLLSMDADFSVIEPYWLRERMISGVKRFLINNENLTDPDD